MFDDVADAHGPRYRIDQSVLSYCIRFLLIIIYLVDIRTIELASNIGND